MKVRYTFSDRFYVLTNFANSNNPLFTSEEETNNFKKRLFKGLSGLCDILAFSFKADHYQLVVYLHSREKFIEFYRRKHSNKEISEEQIPETTYILSQEMANIQSGYAKWFNYRHGRYGSLFGRRYTKVLIRNKEELSVWVKAVSGGQLYWNFSDFWSYIKNFIKRLRMKFEDIMGSGIVERGSFGEEKSNDQHFSDLDKYFLRGRNILSSGFT